MRKKGMIGLCLALQLTLLTGCQEIGALSVGTAGREDKTAGLSAESARYELTANDCLLEAEDAVEIDLSRLEDGTYQGYTVTGGQIVVTEEGSYRLQGTLDGGGVTVRVYEDEVVHLILDNATIRSANGAAIYGEKAAKVVITAKEGTENVLSDSIKSGGGQKACLFGNTDLTINGSGRLSVYGYYEDGIRARDQLKVVAANLYVKARAEALRGNDGVILLDSAVEAECKGTGILARSEKDLVTIQGGSLKVIAGENAIAAKQYVSISDCRLDLYSVWDKVNCDGIREFDEGLLA